MNTEYMQSLRYRLQRRTRRVLSSGHIMYHSALKQFWDFLDKNVILSGILDILAIESGKVENEVLQILAGDRIVFDTEEEQVLASYLIIRNCIQSDDSTREYGLVYGVYSNASGY